MSRRFLRDVNVLLALLDPQHVVHGAAHRWAERESGARWLTCPLVQNGALCVASQPAYSGRLGTAGLVREVLATSDRRIPAATVRSGLVALTVLDA